MSARKAARPSRARRPHAAETVAVPMAPEPAANRAAIAVLVTLAALVVIRALAAVAPGRGAWGLDLVRFVSPPFGWPLLALAALALVPPVAKRLLPLLDGIGDAIADRPVATTLIAMLGGAGIVLAFPDQLRFVGDFLLRQGTIEEAGKPGVLFPQALPLDVLLHVTLPSWLLDQGWLSANGAARALGAVEAALLAGLAVMLARVLDLRGAVALAVAALAWWSGALSMFTGYSKAFAELGLLATAAGVFALKSVRRGTPPVALGLVLAIGLTLHRSALGLVPVVALTFAIWAWTQGRTGGWRRPAAWIALAIPLAALAFMLPKIVATFLRWDSVHLTPKEVTDQGGPLRAAFAGLRPLDMGNLLMVLAPVLPVALVAFGALGRAIPRRREALVLAALVLPLTAVIPFIHPAQGFFRDWDDFASAGAALAVAGAWGIGEVLRAAPRFAWLALAATLGAIAPTLQWLAVQHQLDHGLARVEAIVTGPPKRQGSEWGNTWDYLGIRNYRLERWEASARAFGQAAITSPSPRILLQWGLAEAQRRDWAASMRVNRMLVERDPDNYNGWGGIGAAASNLTDVEAAREAAREMNRIRPGDRNAKILLESLEEYLAKHPDFAREVARREAAAAESLRATRRGSQNQ